MPSPTLLQKSIHDDTLFLAWQKVRENDGMPGVDDVTIERFGQDWLKNLPGLRDAVLQGSYQPLPLLQLRIEREGRKPRYLAVPTVRDRVLQTAVALVITPILEAEFEESSFAYRAGRSVQMALKRVAALRDQGFQWVVDADISAYFDNIDHAQMLEELRQVLPDDSLSGLIGMWLKNRIKTPDGYRLPDKGIPQGSPLSPVLANLYLDRLDEAMLGENLCMVRFADDFLILCKDRAEAEEALDLTEDLLESLKLRLNKEKTRIVHFDDGFRFLGFNFIREAAMPEKNASPAGLRDAASVPAQNSRPLPPAGEGVNEAAARPATQAEIEYVEHDELTPAVRTLYLFEQGCALLKEGQRLVVSRRDETLYSIPAANLDQVVIHGNNLVSTAAMLMCAEKDIAVYFCGHGGTGIVRVDDLDPRHLHLHRRQFAQSENPQFCLDNARAMVAAKIANSRLLVRRYARNHPLPQLNLETSVDRSLECIAQ